MPKMARTIGQNDSTRSKSFTREAGSLDYDKK
jgi:hypothetical protein